ncbi:MAG: cell division protein SepF [Candidatus Aenigmarchaeota archaeon]|nr:cell division protein SepF [Candidatus Aenigmarchaeota archaeon]
MVFGKLRDMMSGKKDGQQKPQAPADEYVELGENMVGGDGKVGVRIETLIDYNDTDRIQQLLREGNVVFLRVRELRSKDMAELKRSVEKLRKTCTAMNGDMVGVDEDFLVVTPQYAQIYRGRTM